MTKQAIKIASRKLIKTDVKCKRFEECGEYLNAEQVRRGKKYHSHSCSLKAVSEENYHFLNEWLKDPKNKEALSQRGKKAGKKAYGAIVKWRNENPEKFKEQSHNIGVRSAKKNWNNPETKERIVKKLSVSLIGNKNSLGAKHSEETKKILSKQKMGNNFGKFVIRTPELNKRVSESNKITTAKLISEGKHVLQRMKRITYSEDKFAKMHPYLKRQVGFKRFIFDFFDEETKTDIEIDGSMHEREDRKLHDIERDSISKSFGIKVVRIPVKDVLKNNFLDWRNYK